MMILQWFDASEATKIGVELADQFARQQGSRAARQGSPSALGKQADELHLILEQADREVRALRLNFYKKAKFANAFKWRLTENGVEPSIADALTQSLILHLSQEQPNVKSSDTAAPRRVDL